VWLRWPLGVVDVVYARRGDVAERALAAQADGFEHIDRCSAPIPRRSRCRSGARPRSRSRSRWCATPAPSAADGMWERAVRWWRAAPGALLEPWAGAVVNSSSRCARSAPRSGRAAARRHRARRRLGRRSVRAARPRRPRAAPPGQAGHTQLHVDDPTGVVDFAAVLARARPARLPRQAQRRVLRPPRTTAGPRRSRAVGARSRARSSAADAGRSV
jgi:hypothetical protein